MRLERSDAELFYQLWFPLLDFVNRRYHICPDAGIIDKEHGVDASDAKAIADYLWSNTELIEEYLSTAKLSEENAQIVSGWQQCKTGRCTCAVGCRINSFQRQHNFGWAGNAVSYLLWQRCKRRIQRCVHERKEKQCDPFLYLSK